MKLLTAFVFTAIISLNITTAGAQTVDEIINKHIEAIGGKDKVGQVKTVYMEGTLDLMGNQAPSVTQIVHGKGYKNEVDFNGTKMVTVYTDKAGWTLNPMAGQTEPTPVAEDVLKNSQMQLDATGPLFDYAAKGNKVQFVGREKGTYHLKVSTPSNADIAFYIDTTSYYISSMVMSMNINGQDIEMLVENSDYKKIDNGLIMPFSTKLDFRGTGLVITTNQKKIEINKEIDVAIFEMPKN
jgi:hypothetical protein